MFVTSSIPRAVRLHMMRRKAKQSTAQAPRVCVEMPEVFVPELEMFSPAPLVEVAQ